MDYESSKEIYVIREPVGEEYNKNAILIFGCSYGYGFLLKPEQTLGNKLSEKLHRPVYNFSSPGQSPQFALMRIRSHEIDDIIKKSDYVIYVLIGEHAWRIYTNSNGFLTDYIWPKYDIKKTKNNVKLTMHKYHLPFIEGSYLYKYIQKLFYARFLMKCKNKYIQDFLFDNLKIHLLTIQKELKSINPNIKMIIISFHDNKDTELVMASPRWKEMQQEDIIVIDTAEYLPEYYESEDYIIPNDGHPSELTWTKLVKILTNDLKLIN